MEEDLFGDNFKDEDDVNKDAFKKNVFKPSTLWLFYKKACVKYFPDMKIPDRASMKILANLKYLKKQYGEIESKKYIAICVRDWSILKRKYKKKSNFPVFSDIFYLKDKEINDILKFGKVITNSNVYRGDDDRTQDLINWVKKNE